MKGLRVLDYLLRSSFQSFRNTWLIQTITSATVATTLVVLGGSWVLFENVRSVLRNSQGNTHISVYFSDGEGPRAGKEASGRFCQKSFVTKCLYLSDDEAKQKFVSANPALKGAVDSLGTNPFPASLEFDLDSDFRDRQAILNFARELEAVPGVEFVDDGYGWMDRWLTFLALADWAIWTLGIALGLAMIFVVGNTIKLVVYSRRDEVDILRLVGASPWMIRFPFLIEGFLQGVFGSLIALGILYAMFFYVRNHSSDSFSSLIASLVFLPLSKQAELLALGAGMGTVGAVFAVGRFLKG